MSVVSNNKMLGLVLWMSYFLFSSNSSVLYFIILLVSDKSEFKSKQLILPLGSL